MSDGIICDACGRPHVYEYATHDNDGAPFFQPPVIERRYPDHLIRMMDPRVSPEQRQYRPLDFCNWQCVEMFSRTVQTTEESARG